MSAALCTLSDKVNGIHVELRKSRKAESRYRNTLLGNYPRAPTVFLSTGCSGTFPLTAWAGALSPSVHKGPRVPAHYRLSYIAYIQP